MQATEVASESVPTNRQPNMAIVCLLGLCASLMTWGVLQWKYPFFTVSDEFSIGMGASNEAREALQNEQSRANRLNSTVVLAVGGGLLAGCLAIFAQPCCAVTLRLITASIGGLVWGGVTGFVGASLFSAMMPSNSLPSPTNIGLAQAAVFAMFGAGSGLLYGMFGRAPTAVLNCMGIGATAGAVGGVLFPIVASLAFPNQSTVEFIGASGVVRLMWLAFPMVSIAAAVTAFSVKMKR